MSNCESTPTADQSPVHEHSASPPPARPVLPSDSRSTRRHPLGPLVWMVRLDHPISGRLYALGLAGAALAILITAFMLHPNQRGVGTHQQLGLPACGFEVMTDLPCPTCGMTTAFSATVHGQWILAIRAQFAGFILAIATAFTALVGLYAGWSGRRPTINWYRIDPLRLVWAGGVLFILAWAIKLMLRLVGNG